MTQVLISAWPVRPPRNGKVMAYGLYHSSATRTDTGETLASGGIDEAAARRRAQRTAAAEWGDLLTFLDEETRFAEAAEAGDVELRD